VCFNNDIIFKYGGLSENNKHINIVEQLKNNEWEVV
jgi:hypothetical protein